MKFISETRDALAVLVKFTKNAKSIVEQAKANESKKLTEEWYFTKEGEAAYNAAKTPAKKALYFFDYLLTLAESHAREITTAELIDSLECDRLDLGGTEYNQALFKIAYIMAESMDGSSLEFGGYPNILDEKKNPLVRLAKNVWLYKDQNLNGLLMLAGLWHEDDISALFECTNGKNPYSYLTFCNAGKAVPDMYKIERDIIAAFCAEPSELFTGSIKPPYVFVASDD